MHALMAFTLRGAPLLLAAAVGVAPLPGETPRPPSPAANTVPAANDDLATLFEPGRLLQDRNGDHVVDFVDAHLILGEAPSTAAVIAAGNIAARLGFETSAMNLPLTEATTGTPIVVGAAGALQARLSVPDAAGEVLAAGEGAVAIVRVGDTPGVAVVSSDDEGLRAAAEALAARLPRLWDPSGPTLSTVEGDLRSLLDSKGVPVARVRIPLIRVMRGSSGLEALTVEARVASQANLESAAAALRQVVAGRSSQTTEAPAKASLSYAGVRVVRVRLMAGSGGGEATVDIPRAGPGEQAAPGRRAASAKDSLDLASLYANTGLLGDSDSNVIPDRVDALIVPHGDGIEPSIDLAARLGLESTGVSLPLVVPASAIDAPQSEPTLVLAGTGHPLIERLVKDGKVDVSGLQPGEGLIRVVKKAFADKTAVIVTGGDASGVRAALREMAEHWPNVSARGKDRTTLEDVADDVRRSLSGQTPIGQAATALYKLDRLTAAAAGKDLESASVRVYVNHPAEGLADVVRARAAAALPRIPIEVGVEGIDVQHAKPIQTDEFDVPSEVDEFWRLFHSRVLPAVRPGEPVVVEARLSEPAAVRELLAREARAALLKAGAPDTGTKVTVLCAYKQGYSWLYDVVRPALAGKTISDLTIRFAEVGPPAAWKQQVMYAPTRWLLEIYPIDEVLARELPLNLSHIHFEKAPIGSPVYEVTATGPQATVFHDTFEPRVVLRSFFDQFPNYEKVEVTTGWLMGAVGGREVVSERIETDPERFWDHFQAKTLPGLYEYVMALTEGKPRAADAPFFGELRVDVSLSEPDEKLGVDQERISPMDSLHEEIYFNTLHFFDLFGRFTSGTPLSYVGRIIPLVHAKADGAPGHARITLTGFGSSGPGVVLDYTERGRARTRERLDVAKVALEAPMELGARVRAGRPGLAQLDFQIKVDSDRDERDALIVRADEDQVDQEMMSAEQVGGILRNVEALRAAGLYRDELAYHDLGDITVSTTWEYEATAKTQRTWTLAANGTPAPWPSIARHRGAAASKPGAPLVQWDTPIGPDEVNGVLARMAAFPQATVYKAGETYLGEAVWAMDLTAPIQASHWSHAKATTFKPTLVYSARQHANEVSSTSHVLRMAERLLTDPARRSILDRVNVVVQPIVNVDGARLDSELYKLTPEYILHAAYYGALGVNATQGQWVPNPLSPEASVRPLLWQTWLPDAFLDPHGYPSHEWIQMFSGYSPWVRTRIPNSRGYWSLRGWWQPRFDWMNDPKFPRHKAEEMRILDVITTAINNVPEIKALNTRAYARHHRYGAAFDPKNFKEYFADGVLTNMRIKGWKPNATVNDFSRHNPNVTIWDGATEAPDETVSGEWLRLVCSAGLAWDESVLDFYAKEHAALERKATAFRDGVTMSVNRPRPPKRPAE
jgi:zinc carboxypeptidase